MRESCFWEVLRNNDPALAQECKDCLTTSNADARASTMSKQKLQGFYVSICLFLEISSIGIPENNENEFAYSKIEFLV